MKNKTFLKLFVFSVSGIYLSKNVFLNIDFSNDLYDFILRDFFFIGSFLLFSYLFISVFMSLFYWLAKGDDYTRKELRNRLGFVIIEYFKNK